MLMRQNQKYSYSERNNQRKQHTHAKADVDGNADGATAATLTALKCSTLDHINDSTTSENESESEQSSSFCRHCLRPQSELQMHYLRPRQRSKLRHNKNQRQQKCNNSNLNSGKTVRKRNKQQQQQQQQQHQQQYLIETKKTDAKKRQLKPVIINEKQKLKSFQMLPKSTLIACDSRSSAAVDLNAANAEVIRFRSPQVGPLVGHNVASGPMHFHHPLHQQQHHYAYQQYQQYQQQLQQQQPQVQYNILPEQPIRPNSRGELRQKLSPFKQMQQQLEHEKNLELPLSIQIDVAAEQTEQPNEVANGTGEAGTLATPDSASLVKVHTWYTVTKQGVSC